MSMSVRRDPRGTFASALMLGGLFSIVFISAVAKVALVTGVLYVFFPELGALSYDVFTRPAGTWARAPVMLAITPTVTAAMGTALTHVMPYGLAAAALTIGGAVLIVRVMRSPILPAVSAAFLPLVFGITSWWYPISIAVMMTVLAVASILQRRIIISGEVRQAPAADAGARADETQRERWFKIWPLVFIAFLLLVYGVSVITGIRLILFPPLVVIAIEMFAHADVRPWAKRPLVLPLVCTIAAGAGIAALLAFGVGPLSVVISLLAGIATLRALRLHFPPALTMGLLPQIMPAADWSYVLAVAVGTSMLVGVFLLARPVLLNRSVMLEAG
jgi:hypothetical protein